MTATKPRSFRLAPHELDRVERCAEHLHISQGRAVALAAQLLEENLGLTRRAGVDLAERLARQHGDQAPVTVTLRHNRRTGYYATVTVAGEPVDELLEAWITMAVSEIGGHRHLEAVTLHLRDDAGVNYLLGTLAQPAKGDELTVVVGDLPGLVVERSRGGTDREWRENLQMDMKLRQLLHGVDDDEEDEQ